MDAPEDWLEARARALQKLNVLWRRQLYSRRRAGTRWVDVMASRLDIARVARCDIAPQYFADCDRDIFSEVHVRDLCGSGTQAAIKTLTGQLSKEIHLKDCATHEPGNADECL